MQVKSLLSRKEHSHDHGHDHDHDHDHSHSHDEECSSCGHDHSHTPVRLQQTVIGLILVLNSFVVEWTFGKGSTVADFSAMIGALILGYPIVWTALKDLRAGILSTNELVGLAVIASFASANYQEAGIVAFFMLLGG